MLESSIDPFSSDFLKNPYSKHELLRELGPVVFLRTHGVYVMARHGEVQAALRNHESFCSSAGVGLENFKKTPPWRPQSFLLESSPCDHEVPRRVLSRVLAAPAIRELRSILESKAAQLVAVLIRRGQFDGIEALARNYVLSVFGDVVGLPADGREQLTAYSDMVFQALGCRNALFADATVAGVPAGKWLTRSCRRETLTANGLGAKIHDAATTEGLSVEQAELLVRLFVAAGVDTTVHGLGNALLCFAQHPKQWTLLHEDPKRARAAFQEVIRFESPLQSVFRTTTREVEVGSTVIPNGEKVLLLLGSANRDPRRWERPDEFDITRRTGGHLGFGFGLHYCVGRMLANLESESLIVALAQRVKHIELVGQFERKPLNVLRGLARLPLSIG